MADGHSPQQSGVRRFFDSSMIMIRPRPESFARGGVAGLLHLHSGKKERVRKRDHAVNQREIYFSWCSSLQVFSARGGFSLRSLNGKRVVLSSSEENRENTSRGRDRR